MDYQALFLTAEGRINRKTYWIGAVILFVVNIVLTLLGLAAREHISILYWLFTLVSIALIYPGLCIAIKRFHDRDKSGWWVLIALIPLIGWIWYLIEVGFLPGTNGPNQYGLDSRAV
jgi:uncharacterized membrane protein YhaH (DUF805 family)